MILGCARSGTSMVTGLFRGAGYFMGRDMMPASKANPLGYFEAPDINDLNNEIIELLLHWPCLNRIRRRISPTAHTNRRAFPLAAPRTIRKLAVPSKMAEEIRDYCGRTPFCYKDPRFSVTLPVWRSSLPQNTKFIVVFREPLRTVDSMLRNSRETYTPPLPVSEAWCYRNWSRTYRRLLSVYSREGDWFFAHYNQIADLSALDGLSEFLGHDLDASQIDPSIRRSKAPESRQNSHERNCAKLYSELCAAAGYDPTTQ